MSSFIDRIRSLFGGQRETELEEAHEENLSGEDFEGRRTDATVEQFFPGATEAERDA